MVEDIYGKNSHNLGLPGNIVASSMAKICRYKP
jgi:pantothenate kinase